MPIHIFLLSQAWPGTTTIRMSRVSHCVTSETMKMDPKRVRLGWRRSATARSWWHEPEDESDSDNPKY